MSMFFCILFAVLTLLAVSLQKTYQAIPAKELKRRARDGDEFARLLHRAAGYGYSLQAILWVFIGLGAAGFFLLAARIWPTWFALFMSALLVWLSFFWIPTGHVTDWGLRLAGWLAPMFSWLLGYLHPVLDKIIGFVGRHRPVHVHTGVYHKDDLVELIRRQRQTPGNRITPTELEIVEHALLFGDRIVRDIMTPRRVVRTVRAEDAIGPVLMDELHASGFSRFPVYEGPEDKIVGTLYLHDLMRAKHTGHVHDLMRDNQVCYVHEEQPLTEALQAILKTHRHLMIVVNSFEEYVGILTIEDVLEQIVGRPIVDEFDQYEDLRAVAAKMAKKDHALHTDHAKPTQEQGKVVE
jgi:CBS domain containing-hemolysin-like protein